MQYVQYRRCTSTQVQQARLERRFEVKQVEHVAHVDERLAHLAVHGAEEIELRAAKPNDRARSGTVFKESSSFTVRVRFYSTVLSGAQAL